MFLSNGTTYFFMFLAEFVNSRRSVHNYGHEGYSLGGIHASGRAVHLTLRQQENISICALAKSVGHCIPLNVKMPTFSLWGQKDLTQEGVHVLHTLFEARTRALRSKLMQTRIQS